MPKWRNFNRKTVINIDLFRSPEPGRCPMIFGSWQDFWEEYHNPSGLLRSAIRCLTCDQSPRNEHFFNHVYSRNYDGQGLDRSLIFCVENTTTLGRSVFVIDSSIWRGQ